MLNRVLAVGLSLTLLTLGAKPVGVSNPNRADSNQENTAQVKRGAEIYALRCAVCHGDTGSGLSEARLAFPEDHRRCESCHKPGNPDRQADMRGSFETMRGRRAVGNAFSIGDAPALRGPNALDSFADAAALRAYINAAMPRHAPGSLNEVQSGALSAFVLSLDRTPSAD